MLQTSAIDWFLAHVDRRDAVQYAKSRTLVIGSLFAVLVAVGFFFERSLFEPSFGPQHLTVLVAALAALGAPFTLRVTRSYRLAMGELLTVLTCAIAADGWVYGGLGSASFLAITILPLMGMLFGGLRVGIVVTVAQLAVVVAFFVLEASGGPMVPAPARSRALMMHAAATCGVISFTLLLAATFERERRAAEERLKESEGRLAQAFASANDGLFEWIPGARGFASASLLAYLGGEDRPDPGALWFRDRIHESDRPAFDEALRSSHVEGEPRVLDLRVHHRSGEVRVVECRISALGPVADGRRLGTIRDVHEERRLHALQNRFVAMVSHELRTPLTSIIGSLRILDAGAVGELAPPVKRLVAMAESNSQRLAALVDDLLDIQKLDAQEMALELVPLELDLVMTDAVASARGFADARQVSILPHPGSGRSTVRGESKRLVQVAVNLLSNAIKFSPAGGRVSVALEERGGAIRLSVSDEGPGVPLDFRGRVFERFAQAGSLESSGLKGSGLGLAISKAIVDLHGGRIGFDSEPGAGATFWFELPRAD